uniref:Uncharacterized protein n=1 Tax=Fusarium oxysporum (strain Fo5176) TaxID=660025 RepID=A0A0D2XGR1_FUSOF
MVGCQTTTACLFDLGNEALLIDRVTPMRKTNVEGRPEVGGLLGDSSTRETTSGLDLAKLELDKFIIGVILCVVMSEDLEGIVVLILAEEPTGTLGHPKDSDEDDDAAYGLEKAGKSPGPMAFSRKPGGIVVRLPGRFRGEEADYRARRVATINWGRCGL